MSRPTKQGLDYFPLDVQFDGKVELFIAETGAEGLGVLLTIWQLIYQNEGYYIKAGEDIALLVMRRTMTPPDKVNDIINVAVKREIFVKNKLEEHNILTSKAIQKRYFSAAKRKKEVSINKNYICQGVDVGVNTSCGEEDSNQQGTGSGVNVNKNYTRKSKGSTSSKQQVNKNATKESKGKESKGKESKNTPPTLSEVEDYFHSRGYTKQSAGKAFDYYSVNNWHDGKGNKVKNWKQKMIGVWFKPENKASPSLGGTCSSCSKFCKPGSPDRCHKSATRKACNEFS